MPAEEARRPVRLRKRLSVLRLGMVLPLQIRRDFGELGEGGLEVFDDFLGDDVWIGARIFSISAFPLFSFLQGSVFEAFVFEPEDVEVEFVALE
jgi:hypothetical protein